MATRAENAKAIQTALSLQIDTEKPDPKAAQLEGWATRLTTERDAVQKEILTWQVQQALDVEVTDPGVTTEQLQGWLARAETERDAVLGEIQSASTPTPAADLPTPLADGLPTVTVRVVGRTASYGGAYTDPESKKSLGVEPVTVPLTGFVQSLLDSGTLVEAE
ncbi:hypothetical protein [Deinococcus sp. QL22]|uniref:hypothetical protein n=1 Tax=Deinococcus sp. QL22 TaxID=2939437 RepID=UPI002018367D|nr:hypothetical protein [Deinococcus sp. QL22]UQN10373.1 hypothetical protein M1R55_29925 [Deinococcus sp. QL22]UQN10507.1 hypothetical protein M1R55_29250 [Deinococcus sp. QL22]